MWLRRKANGGFFSIEDNQVGQIVVDDPRTAPKPDALNRVDGPLHPVQMTLIPIDTTFCLGDWIHVQVLARVSGLCLVQHGMHSSKINPVTFWVRAEQLIDDEPLTQIQDE